MDVASGEKEPAAIWSRFQAVIQQNEPWVLECNTVNRNIFYEHARQVYAIVTTGERRRYANIIQKKDCRTGYRGLIRENSNHVPCIICDCQAAINRLSTTIILYLLEKELLKITI